MEVSRTTSGGFPESKTPTPAQQKILDTILLLGQLDIARERDVVAAWCKAHPRSKGFINNIGALRGMGYVDGFDLTPEGVARARQIARPSTDELLSVLTPAQRRIVQVVLEHGVLERDELGQVLGVHPRSKGVINNIGALRSRRLLSDDWPLRATHVLKPGGV